MAVPGPVGPAGHRHARPGPASAASGVGRLVASITVEAVRQLGLARLPGYW